MRKYWFCFLSLAVYAGCDTSSSVDNNNNVATPTYAPTVVWTDPLPGAVGPYIMSSDNTVRIRFSDLMNTRSVIHGVSISPSNETVFIDTNKAIPVEGTTFAFPLTPTPVWIVALADPLINARFPVGYQIYNSYYKVGQTYTITIDSLAEDIYGDYLGQTVAFSFTPEPYFRVTDTDPLNYDTAVSPIYPYITIRFNALIDTSTARSSFTLSPSVSGNASFYYGSWGLSWTLPSNAMLSSATAYTVTIGTSIKDVDGHVPPSPYSFSFTTAPYMVTSAYPNESGVSTNSDIYVYCNCLIDSTSAAPAFSINPAVNGSLQVNGSSLTFIPQSVLSSNTQFTVTVSAALRAKNGTGIKSPYTFSFTTGS
ncbi:MAG: Ig-like domain-containing protein [Bacteroidota bacterium]